MKKLFLSLALFLLPVNAFAGIITFGVGLDLINAYKIKEASENLATDIQDYDLALEEGLDVVLYKENCNKVPETGDYFFVNPQSHIYLYSAKEFEALYAVN